MSSGSKNTATSSDSAATYKPIDEQVPGFSWLAANLGPMMGTQTPFFPGQGYVAPSALTQQGIAGLQGVNQGYQNAADMMSGGRSRYDQARRDYEASAGGMRDVSGYFNQAGNAYRGAAPGYEQAAAAFRGVAPAFDQAAASLTQASGNIEPYLQQQRANYKFLSNAADVQNNPYVQGMLATNQNEVTKNLKEQLLPQLQKGAMQVNALGSDRLGLAQGRAVEGTSQALANQNARTMMDAYSQGLSAQNSALGMTGQLIQNERLPAEFQAMGARLRGEGAGFMERAAGMGEGAARMHQQGAQMNQYGAGAMNQAGQYMQQAGGLNRLYGQQLADAAGLRAGGLGALLGGGQQVEGYQQKALQDAMARWQHQYTEPWQRISQVGDLMSMLQPLGVQFGSGTNIGANPGYRSPFQNILAGASMLGGMAKIF